MQNKPLKAITDVLIRRTLGWAFVCALLFGGLQGWLTYHNTKNDFERAAHSIANTNVPLLSLAIWDIEPATIQRQITLLTENRQIGYAVVRVKTGQVFEGGNPSSKQHGERMILTIPQPDNPMYAIGTLELVIDGQVLYREILTSVSLVVAECLLLTALILGIVVTILRQNLERPMRYLADFVHGLNADNLATPLALPGPEKNHQDEIDLVVRGFQTLQTSISQHIATLDQRVALRTEQLERALAAMKKMSATDPLTGCYNRMLFDERLSTELIRCERYDIPLSIVFCDVDHFKAFNDIHGHQTGDLVLKSLGTCLLNGIRTEIDWVVRYGGEEFLLIFPETNLSATVEAAERFRVSIEQEVRVMLADATELSITASFGVAQWRPGEDLHTLVDRADHLLYQAKRNGRNQVQPSLTTIAEQLRDPADT